MMIGASWIWFDDLRKMMDSLKGPMGFSKKGPKKGPKHNWCMIDIYDEPQPTCGCSLQLYLNQI